jgi:CheY-like chemotaxis protein/anti-sigma regulatory factor (Ser/Thr protein kinase)
MPTSDPSVAVLLETVVLACDAVGAVAVLGRADQRSEWGRYGAAPAWPWVRSHLEEMASHPVADAGDAGDRPLVHVGAAEGADGSLRLVVVQAPGATLSSAQRRVLDLVARQCATLAFPARSGPDTSLGFDARPGDGGAALAALTHELRTPLNAILGFSEVLLEQECGPLNAKQQGYIGHVVESGQHLLRLITDVLDISKLDAGALSVKREGASARELCEDAVALVAPLMRKKELVCTVVGDARVDTDPVRVRQVLYNLLSNAIKFTARRGTVQLSVSEEGPFARIEVTDDGRGIQPKDLPRVFRPYTQFERGNGEGAGLGLALSKRVVDLLGGEMTVESTFGKSTTLAFTLPLARRRVSTGSPERAGGGNRPSVVVIDDDACAREITSFMLTRSGCIVHAAETIGDGLALARSVGPVAVVLDLVIEGMEGWTALRTLKGNEATRDIPVIVATVHDDRENALEAGADAFLLKPLRRVDLNEALRATSIVEPNDLLLAVTRRGSLDDADNAELEEAFTVVHVAGNARAAAALAEVQPDVVLLDWRDGGGDGPDGERSEDARREVLDLISQSTVPSLRVSVALISPDVGAAERGLLGQRGFKVIESNLLDSGGLGSTLKRVVATLRGGAGL